MKKIYSLILSIIMISTFSLASTTTYERTPDNLQVASRIVVTSSRQNAILNTPKVNEEEKIYDFADLFTDSEEVELYNQVTSFISNTNLDMAIVTIDQNPKYTAQAYADDFYDYNYFGKESTCDGLLFLIDMDTREMYISTGGQAQLIYDDDYRRDGILDATYDKIVEEDYYGCAQSFIEEASYYFNMGILDTYKDYHLDEMGNLVAPIFTSTNLTIIGVISLIISLIATGVKKSKHTTIKKATTAVEYMKTKNLTQKLDNFLTTHTSSVYIPPSSSSSGGGSSHHSGSSGISHGGGGRHF